MSQLDILLQHRQALLLAEMAALLHDMGKCSDEHIINQASDKLQGLSYKYKTAQSHRLPASPTDISLLGETVSLEDLIEKGMPKIISDSNNPWLLRVLGRCHSAAHIEKELSDRDTATKQPKDDTRLSTAYGIEGNAVKGLTALLDTLPFNNLTNRASFFPEAKKAFSQSLADTRRPINEVTLADWSEVVAALYKSALAGALLGIKPDPDDLHWRLLRVNFDVLALYAKAVKIADLLAYQNAVEEACAKIKQLVEEEYPLGNEIYRDTSGIYFTFPDFDLPADLAHAIRSIADNVEPELAPRIAVTIGDGKTAQEQLRSILGKARRAAAEDLKQPFDAANFDPNWRKLWRDVNSEKKWEVCPVCRLRPMEEHGEVCDHCKGRRKSRQGTWLTDPSRTIWMGEIADHNDRVALLVGKFGLEDWLSGNLVQTMLVKAEQNNPAGCIPKNPSPARLRRVWETCQRFWEETVQQGILGPRPCRHRKLIAAEKTGWNPSLYNGKVNDKPLDLFWQPEHNAFLTVSNLQAAGELENGAIVALEDPDTKRKTQFQIQGIREASAPFSQYPPFLSLHASPDQFLAFVPAAEALKIVQEIAKQYERQFGKVRNRLPLALGLIYFERKMPLLAVMDAARQMLNVPLGEEEWALAQDTAGGHMQFENGVTWKVRTTMGDGSTPDEWYPYYFITQADAAKHPRRFQLRKEGDGDLQKVGAVDVRFADRWLVHVNDLKQRDRVSVTPSRFDFIYLDAAARRFEIDYAKSGRRPAQPTRPYYLEDLDRFDEVWGLFSKLTRTQQKQILQTIETARAGWFGRDEKRLSATDETFRQFVTDTLANAQWGWAAIPEGQRNQLVHAAARGELSDLAELHLEILKEENVKE